MNIYIMDRMKANYESRTKYYLPRRTFAIIRCDGKKFSTFTANCRKPFDDFISDAMKATAGELCSQIQGAKLAYVFSDEASVLLTDFDTITTDAWYDGCVQKMVSVSASIATAAFNSDYRTTGKPALFDARVFTIPDRTEVSNYFIGRQQDCTRNSISSAAQAACGHSRCQNKSSAELQDEMKKEGINWNDYGTYEKRGAVIAKVEGVWSEVEPPIFTQDRSFLDNLIPKYEG